MARDLHGKLQVLHHFRDRPVFPFRIYTRLMMAILAGSLGIACVFQWGRPYTTRAALGLLSLGMIGMVVSALVSERPNVEGAGFAALVALMSGAYAVTGYYPRFFPFANVFGRGQVSRNDRGETAA